MLVRIRSLSSPSKVKCQERRRGSWIHRGAAGFWPGGWASRPKARFGTARISFGLTGWSILRNLRTSRHNRFAPGPTAQRWGIPQHGKLRTTFVLRAFGFGPYRFTARLVLV